MREHIRPKRGTSQCQSNESTALGRYHEFVRAAQGSGASLPVLRLEPGDDLQVILLGPPCPWFGHVAPGTRHVVPCRRECERCVYEEAELAIAVDCLAGTRRERRILLGGDVFAAVLFEMKLLYGGINHLVFKIRCDAMAWEESYMIEVIRDLDEHDHLPSAMNLRAILGLEGGRC